MEALHLSSREIRNRFTKSDIAIMGWRSREVSANMRSKTLRTAPSPSKIDGTGYPLMEDVEHDAVLKGIEDRLGDVVYKMTDEKGEIDLRRLTGEEAVQYMNAIGIPVMRM
jgi:hypothetical protein